MHRVHALSKHSDGQWQNDRHRQDIDKHVAGLAAIALIYNVRGTHFTQATNARKIGYECASRRYHGLLYAATKLFRA
jgi:hypothetical protein